LANQNPLEGKAAAIAHYWAALAINPDEPQVHTNLGTALMEMGLYEDALKEFQTAVRLAPGYGEAYLIWAQTLNTLADIRRRKLRSETLWPSSLGLR
jgi:tetratricopeptide (TPR) repeat protein